MFDPDVRDAMLHFFGRCGSLPAATFLLALLVDWDMSDPESKAATLIRAIGVKPTGAAGEPLFFRPAAGERGDAST